MQRTAVTRNRLVPHAQSELLAGALRAAGGDVELGTYEGADHMWLGAKEAADLAVDRTVAFLLLARTVGR